MCVCVKERGREREREKEQARERYQMMEYELFKYNNKMPNSDKTKDFAHLGERPLSQSEASESSCSRIWKMSCMDSF